MYDQYQRDPGSVDATWATYFKTNGHANGTNGATTTATTTAPAAPAKPADKRADKPAAPTQEHAPDPTPTPAPVAKPRPDTKAAEPAKGTTKPVPKESRPAAPEPANDEPTYTVLRGAPARTAQNMDVSLTVPTATSVRSVPVKLLWDNRTVINNHLARARGGKVSFTHLIGYAMVQALKSMPEM